MQCSRATQDGSMPSDKEGMCKRCSTMTVHGREWARTGCGVLPLEGLHHAARVQRHLRHLHLPAVVARQHRILRPAARPSATHGHHALQSAHTPAASNTHHRPTCACLFLSTTGSNHRKRPQQLQRPQSACPASPSKRWHAARAPAGAGTAPCRARWPAARRAGSAATARPPRAAAAPAAAWAHRPR